ncbi:hypothetical protein CspeluHIS016_0701210 [Cutaneotrichosporon spelunceum]|uniref:GDT1 family protein n=1 Tax=Cutaneotrichosporon spelunceum TaxID=1672016 RepID=A0AAD3YDH1_9TREE|nr:hypothetical protein CspeluHIS016_0701210 [Cutaneotrichosporon spelunceum]
MAEQKPEEGNFHAFCQAFVMIVVSEIGDKTFLIAAILASKHSRVTVFAGALGSLVIMSVLSAALGKFILGLVPKVWTLWVAAALFLVFGVKMAQESRHMVGDEMAEEMREAEEEIKEDSAVHDPTMRGSMPLESIEEGRVARPLTQGLSGRTESPAPERGRAAERGRRTTSRSRSRPSIQISLPGVGPLKDAPFIARARESCRSGLQMVTNPVFAQAFILTFLGEWGDRSQITTIAMAGAHSVPVIAFGTILGHSLCTLMAVIAGRWISTKLSVKKITVAGSIAFVFFGFLYGYEAYTAGVNGDLEW